MSNAGKRFTAAMETDVKMEATAKGIMMALNNLALEIAQKPVQTDAEATFLKAFLHVTILAVMANPIGGKS